MEDWAVDYMKPKVIALANMLEAFSKDYHYYAWVMSGNPEIVRTKRDAKNMSEMTFMLTKTMYSELEQAKTPNDLLLLYKRIKRREYDD